MKQKNSYVYVDCFDLSPVPEGEFERFMANMVIRAGFKITIKKIIDPIGIITGITGENEHHERFEVSGRVEVLEKVTKYIENGSFDFSIKVIKHG